MQKSSFLRRSLFAVPSLLRDAEYKALSGTTLSGKVLDLGGDKNSGYTRLFSGDFSVTTVNISESVRPDIVHNLERPLPLQNESYDHVLLINVLEHVFEYRVLLKEAFRVVKPGGSVVIIVPFLFPVHPSPHDFHRFTSETLQRELEREDAIGITIHALGSGVFSAQYVLLDRLLPKPLRFLSFYTIRYAVLLCDFLWSGLARLFKKKYKAEEYALGYIAKAKKP